jgi:hypothetical protein
VIEAIGLLEGDLANAVDAVWVVNASPATQLKRLMEKRKLSEADARQRIAAQSAQADKIARANFVVNNDSDIENTWKQVQAGWAIVRRAVAPPAAPPAPSPVQPRPAAPTAAPPAPAAPPPAAPPQRLPHRRLHLQDRAPPAPAAVTSEATVPVRPAERRRPRQQRPKSKPAIPIVPAPPLTRIEVKPWIRAAFNAAQIADFINKVSSKGLTRMDVMMAFGQKSYLIAEMSANVVGVVGWQVENLITRVDEFYLQDVPGKKKLVIQGLINAIRGIQDIAERSRLHLPAGRRR